MRTVVRWNPLREMAAMQSAMDRIFEDTWRGYQDTLDEYRLPLDVFENENAYVITAAIPGVNADDIQITFQDSTLTISAEIPQPELNENEHALLNERRYGKFMRTLNMSHDIDADNVEAAYENGVLALTLPKLPEAKPRQIQVKASKMLKSKN